MENTAPYRKRKSCESCVKLKARCDAMRPCVRCVRKGCECVDVPRKSRKEPTIAQHMKEIDQIETLLQQPLPATLQTQFTKEWGDIEFENILNLPDSDSLLLSIPSPSFSDSSVSISISPSSPNPVQITNPSEQISNLYVQITNPISNPSSPISNFAISANNLLDSATSHISISNPAFMQELQILKKKLDNIVSYMESSMPKEIPVAEDKKAIMIMNPQKLEIVDCNRNFSEILGFHAKNVKGTPFKDFYIPFFLRIILRDMTLSHSFCMFQKYGAFRHSSNNAVYCLLTINKVSMNNVIVTVTKVCEEMPPCLRLALDHYMGLISANEPIRPTCNLELCQCKFLHIPLLPPEQELNNNNNKM